MKAKEYLSRLKKLDSMINQKLEELSAARALMTSISAVDTSKDGGLGCTKGDAGFVKAILRVQRLEAEADSQIDFYIDEKDKIINQIQGLTDWRHIEILFKKYVEYKKLEDVADEMYYTYPYIVTLHGYALKEFQEKYLQQQ